MKTKIVTIAMIFSSALFLLAGCKKDNPTPTNTMAQVKIQIDYLGAGGYYNDDMAGVPSGLVVGTNGPYSVDPTKSYTLTYKADSNFPEIQITNWTPTTTGVWVVHCYVDGNQEHIQAYPED